MQDNSQLRDELSNTVDQPEDFLDLFLCQIIIWEIHDFGSNVWLRMILAIFDLNNEELNGCLAYDRFTLGKYNYIVLNDLSK